ncbi:proteasome stabiliser-domain-containing protein [Zopfochytrium polystomum]|nr:proteasome stabiliser-domain-containing protein [Zopfochytrium polystomum]
MTELELLENVELKFALADTDAKFERVLGTFLSPVVAKLASPKPEIRNKVTSLCSHAMKRLKSSADLKVPVDALLNLMSASSEGGATNALVFNFTLLFLELGFARLSEDDAVTFLPRLVADISSRTSLQQKTLFHISLPVFAKFGEKRQDSKDSPFDFKSRPADLKFLLGKFLDVILYTVPTSAEQAKESVHISPGLSKSSLMFITNDLKAKWTKSPAELKSIKAGILRLVQNTNIVEDTACMNEKFFLHVAAGAEANHDVVALGEDGLKRLTKPDFEDDEFVKGMFRLYQGVTHGQPDELRSPGSLLLKVKVLQVLLKSAKAANSFPSMVQVSFDALYGEGTNARLRSAGMSFIQWIARMASPSVLRPIAPVLLSGLLKLIGEELVDPSVKDNENLKGFAYEAVGLLSKKAPEEFRKDLSLLEQFFSAVRQESRNVRVSVQDALVMMIDAFKDLSSDPGKLDEIEAILLENVHKTEPQSRYVACKFANALFEFSRPSARYIAMVAASDSKLEIREEGRRGLSFPEFPGGRLTAEDQAIRARFIAQLPSISRMTKFIQEMSKRPLQEARAAGVRYIGSLSAETFSIALDFIRKLLMVHSRPTIKIETLADLHDGVAKVDNETRAELKIKLSSLDDDDRSGVTTYLELIEMSLDSKEIDAALQVVASASLYEMISLSSSTLTAKFTSKRVWLKSFLSASRSETRLHIARILAILFTANLNSMQEMEDFTSIFDGLVRNVEEATKKEIDLKQGAIVALGAFLGRLRYRYPNSLRDHLSESKEHKVLRLIAQELESTSSSLTEAACVAIAEIAKYGTLTAELPLDASKSDEKVWNTASVLEKLQKEVKATKDTKLQELFISTIGYIALGSPAEASGVVDYLFTLPPIFSKNVEVHFTIGEAFCAATFGWKATCFEEFLDIPDLRIEDEGTVRSDVSAKALKRCFVDARPAGVLAARKGICVWLMTLVKYCGGVEEVKAELPNIHSTFSGLIADRDEFVQDVASKGIGMVYELGDETLKASLVQSLVSTFTEGRRIAPQSVTAETQLFQEGALGSTPDGSSLTTYQSILSLASDLNQPDLVYKFMSLASNNALWNTRRGASMGFTTIASLAEEQLAPFLPRLLPRLFIFQFDPVSKVSESMKSIWKALVRDPKKAVDENFDAILKEILKSMGDRMWRTRESSCLALSDLLQGRQMDQFESSLEQIWTMCFRALDDIKESVRVAAFTTCKTLTNLTVRYCDPTAYPPSKGSKVVDVVVPFFLTKGLQSMAEDVRKFSLSTILKICKIGGILLKPHMTEIIYTLLESLTALEPQVLNYLTFHVEKYNLTQDQLESSRLSAAKASPMMEAVEKCIENMDANIFESLSQKLITLIRKGMGLPTKAGTARFVVSIVTRCPDIVKPHSDAILKALASAVSDRSAAVRKSFATAIGYISRLASDTALQKLFKHLQDTYVEAEDDEARSIPGIIFRDISRFSSDALSRFSSTVLPLAYIGMHDGNKEIADSWASVWEENTASASAAVKLHLPELTGLCKSLLASTSSWTVKKQIGGTLRDVAKSISSQISLQMDVIVPILLESLSGRTWEGKEAILEALVICCVEGKDYLREPKQEKMFAEVVKVVLREAKKINLNYRKFALDYLGQFFEGLELDRFDDVEDYLTEILEGKDDEEDSEEPSDKGVARDIQINAFQALGKCWPTQHEKQVSCGNNTLKLLAKGLKDRPWNVRIVILEASEKVFAKSTLPVDEIFSLGCVDEFIQNLVLSVNDGKYAVIREKAAKTIENMMLLVLGTGLLSDETRTRLAKELDDAIQREGLSSIADVLKRVRIRL